MLAYKTDVYDLFHVHLSISINHPKSACHVTLSSGVATNARMHSSSNSLLIVCLDFFMIRDAEVMREKQKKAGEKKDGK